MTAHKIDSKSVKSKIILPLKLSTRLLHKKKKITTSINKIRKSTIYFYRKTKINTVLVVLKIQNKSLNQHKVHRR